jgi:HK97 family phage major capsid protein
VEPVTDNKTFDADYVKEIREEAAHYRVEAKDAKAKLTVLQKGYLPTEVTPSNSDVTVHINKFPLGDADNFSVSRAAMAKGMSDGRLTGSAWDKFAPWEKAYLSALAETKASQGDQISGIDGGFLAPEVWNLRWFDLLRAQSALDQLPITRMAVPARMARIPKVLIDVTVSYSGENTAPTATTFTFGQLNYTARKASAVLNLSNEMIRDSAGLADQILRTSTAGAIATDRDTQLLVGQGTGGALSQFAPVGMINSGTVASNFTYYPNTSVSGAISTTPASFTPSYQHLAQLIAKVEVLSQFSGVNVGQASVNGAIANPQFKQTVWSSARFQTATTAQPIWVDDLNARNGLFGMKWALTNVIPTNLIKGGGTSESVIIIGDWRQYVLFECLTLGFDAQPYSGTSSVGFAADQTQVRVIHRYDGAPAHPEAFGILAGVLV